MTLADHVKAEMLDRLMTGLESREPLQQLGEAFITHHVASFTVVRDGAEQAVCGRFVGSDLIALVETEPTCRLCRQWLDLDAPKAWRPTYYCETCGAEIHHPTSCGLCWTCEVEKGKA